MVGGVYRKTILFVIAPLKNSPNKNLMNKKYLLIIKRIYKIVYSKLKILFLPLSSLFILFIKILHFKKKIKFYPIIYTRIGHLAVNTELLLRRIKSGTLDKKQKYIGVSGKPCNRYLLNMFKREMPIIESRFFRGIITTSIFEKTKYFQDEPVGTNVYQDINNLPGVVNFTQEEEERGIKELKKMGINSQDWFVCFHNRDSEYLSQKYKFIDWSYHNYRDCNILNFLPAMEYVASIGGYAIRMGHQTTKKLGHISNPRIIDYSMNFRSDFMDIYLSSHCKCFVGTTAGLNLVATIFNIPVVGTNIIPIGFPTNRKEDLFIPKKIKHIKENRYLTFREIFERRISTWLHSKRYSLAGLEVIENDSQEILAVVKEMNSILDGSYKYAEEDDFLQRKYWSLIKPHDFCYGCPSRIGREFLIQNQDLLEL